MSSLILGQEDRQAQDLIKVEMLLKEAELFQHDIHVLLFTDDFLLCPVLEGWLGDENYHTGRLNVFVKDKSKTDRLLKHAKIKIHEIHPWLKFNGISEILMIGKEVSVVNVSGKVHINRENQCANYISRIMRSIVRITTVIEKQKGA